MAIGGSRVRVVRQLMTEGLVLALAGSAFALAVSGAATQALMSGLNGVLPILAIIDSSLDWRIFAATSVFAVAATLISSLGPALASARRPALPELKEHAGELTTKGKRFATRNVLVMGQLALSLTLLTTAGAFVRGAVVAAEVDPGFSLDRGIVANLDASLAGVGNERATFMYAQALERLRAVPSVTHAGFGTQMPFGDTKETSRVQKAGMVIGPSDPNRAADTAAAVTLGISTDYFASLGLSLLRGRDFTNAEWLSPGSAPVGIIDQALATRLFGQENPIGRFVQTGLGEDGSVEAIEVVGIAPAIRHQMEDPEPGPHLYRPLAQHYRPAVFVHMQTADGTDEAAMLPAVRALLRDVDAQMPVLSLETGPMFRERNPMLWIVRTGARLFATLGALGLFMAALGIYGVKAYLVSRRTREIGIRLALGATARDVVSLVMSDGLALTAAGLVLGLGLSALTVRGVSGFVFGGAGFDLPIVAAAFLTLAIAALGATWMPTRRAMKIPPTIALRSE